MRAVDASGAFRFCDLSKVQQPVYGRHRGVRFLAIIAIFDKNGLSLSQARIGRAPTTGDGGCRRPRSAVKAGQVQASTHCAKATLVQGMYARRRAISPPLARGHPRSRYSRVPRAASGL